jgi:microcystin degradation protein MlrC
MPFGGGEMPMGEAVWLELENGIDLVVNDTRTQCFHPAAFERLGIRLADKRLVLVKSSNHFHAGFAPIASEVIHVATPGALPADMREIPFAKRAPDWWPLVENPWS